MAGKQINIEKIPTALGLTVDLERWLRGEEDVFKELKNDWVQPAACTYEAGAIQAGASIYGIATQASPEKLPQSISTFDEAAHFRSKIKM